MENQPLQKKGQQTTSKSVGNQNTHKATKGFYLEDNRPATIAQRKLKKLTDNYVPKNSSIQKKANETGLPDNLKSGIENLSSYAMDDVKVHYNSSKPAQLNAHAYAQGTDIHLASGQEKYLPHEAWHVVQQKQGRVQPTLQMKGKVNINDDEGLEKEADIMGEKAFSLKSASHKDTSHLSKESSSKSVLQGVFIYENGKEMSQSVVDKIKDLKSFKSHRRITLFTEQAESKDEIPWDTFYQQIISRLPPEMISDIKKEVSEDPNLQTEAKKESQEDLAPPKTESSGGGVPSNASLLSTTTSTAATTSTSKDEGKAEKSSTQELSKEQILAGAHDRVRATRVPNAAESGKVGSDIKRSLDALTVLMETGMNVCTAALSTDALDKEKPTLLISANDHIEGLLEVFKELQTQSQKLHPEQLTRYIAKVRSIAATLPEPKTASLLAEPELKGGEALHAEMRIVQHLFDQGLLQIDQEADAGQEGDIASPLELYISISKKGCAMCAATLEALNQVKMVAGPKAGGELQGRRVVFKTRGTHGNAYHGWAAPNFLLANPPLLEELVGPELTAVIQVQPVETKKQMLDEFIRDLLTSLVASNPSSEDPTLSDSEDEEAEVRDDAPVEKRKKKKKGKAKASKEKEHTPPPRIKMNSKKRAQEFYSSLKDFKIFPIAARRYFLDLGFSDGLGRKKPGKSLPNGISKGSEAWKTYNEGYRQGDFEGRSKQKAPKVAVAGGDDSDDNDDTDKE